MFTCIWDYYWVLNGRVDNSVKDISWKRYRLSVRVVVTLKHLLSTVLHENEESVSMDQSSEVVNNFFAEKIASQ